MELASLYELERIIATILSNNYKRICFQFTEKYQKDATWLLQTLDRRLQAQKYDCSLYLLADTSYGSCCVDFVGASHVQSDFIVHIGHACLSRNNLNVIPVLYVFCEALVLRVEREDAIFTYFSKVLQEETSMTHFVVFSQVEFCSLGENVAKRLQAAFPEKIISLAMIEKERFPGRLTEWDNFTGWNEKTEKQDLKLIYIQERPTIVPLTADETRFGFFYIGTEGRTLTNLILNFAKQSIFSYNPSTSIGRREGLTVNRDLMRRTLLMNKCMEAEIFGILIGTLGVKNHLHVIHRLTSLIKAAGKKFYLVSVGKLNPAKLANFLEMDAFILVACHENTLLERELEKEFMKPIITPFELMAALNADDTLGLRQWTSDFNTFLSLSERQDDENETIDSNTHSHDNADDGLPRYSFATGKLIQNRHTKQDKDKPLLLAYEAAQSAFDRFEQRTFKGLEKLNIRADDSVDTPVLYIGKTGTARSYQDAKI